MRHFTTLATSLTFTLLLTATASAAPAKPSKPAAASQSTSRWGATGGVAPPVEGISAWGIVPWNGFGIGARYQIPLPIHSLLPEKARIRDRFALEFGADVLYHSYTYHRYYYRSSRYDYSYSWTQVLPVFGAMWNVWLTDKFAVYPKTEIGWGFGWYSGWDNGYGDRPVHGGIHLNGAAGAIYKLGAVSVRAEIGWSGLKAGVGWLF